jgi:hypothetical protein
MNHLPIVGLAIAPPFAFANGWLWRRGGRAHQLRASIVRRFAPKAR